MIQCGMMMADLKNYNFQGLTLLMAEPRFFMRRILRGVLKELNVGEVVESDTIDGAFQSCQDNFPDVVLTDWSPGFDGLSLLQRLRQDPSSSNPFVPVIVVTANTELRHIYRARDAGMTEFLAKPVSAALVYRRLCMVIERQRAFVKCPDFFGPDRRRRRKEHVYEGPERRSRDAEPDPDLQRGA